MPTGVLSLRSASQGQWPEPQAHWGALDYATYDN